MQVLRVSALFIRWNSHTWVGRFWWRIWGQEGYEIGLSPSMYPFLFSTNPAHNKILPYFYSSVNVISIAWFHDAINWYSEHGSGSAWSSPAKPWRNAWLGSNRNWRSWKTWLYHVTGLVLADPTGTDHTEDRRGMWRWMERLIARRETTEPVTPLEAWVVTHRETLELWR